MIFGAILVSLLAVPALADDKVPDNLVQLGSGEYYSNIALVADKSQRQLQVWQKKDGQLVNIKSYPIDLGKNEGDKVARNDHKTPEGIYYFEKMLEGAGLNFQEYGTRAFTMNYPNLFDRREKKTGDGIWLHAVPDKKGLQRGSRGCVVVSNESILDVSPFIVLNRTPIVVDRELNWVTQKDINQQKEAVTTWLKTWLKSWQTENLEEYMTFYDDTFYSRKMTKAEWKTYKNNLNSMYENIKIFISEPYIVRHDQEWQISFLQKYASTNYEDFGEKTLFLKGPPDNLKIIAEDFSAANGTQATAEFTNSHLSCCGDSLSSTN